jgi:choline dehydrogenase-like flavoprotein
MSHSKPFWETNGICRADRSVACCRRPLRPPHVLDGSEIPWPIAYKDVSPYYDQVEQLIGGCGGTDDSDSRCTHAEHQI